MTNELFTQDPEMVEAMRELEIPPATVVSLVPLALCEKKPGLYPGQFDIPAAAKDDIEVIVIGSSLHHVYLDSDRGSLTQENPPTKVARSIVNDYISASMHVDDDARPGLFYVSGGYTKEEIKQKFSDRIAHAKAQQQNWFTNLIRAADDDWQKYHRHQFIMDIQRIALQHMGMHREWEEIAKPDTILRCPACKNPINPGQVICAVCRCVLDKETFSKLEFTGQEVVKQDKPLSIE